QHNYIVQKVIDLDNNAVLQGVADRSPLANLIGFHAVRSLPNDPMHDFHEGVCGQLLMAILKEASAKRLLTYGEIESRLISFEYGMNDKSNKPPILRKKHLNKGKFVAFVILTGEIQAKSPAISFINSNKGKPLLIVADEYAFKLNKATTTTKYWICTINGYAAKVHTDSTNLLMKTVDNHSHLPEKEKLECILFFLGEDIDGETLFYLPQYMMYDIIKPMKERVHFLAEHRDLFHGAFRNNSDQGISEKYINHLQDNNLNNY
ncbi:unnamed protein product, partial [Rotaria sp. Silwood1]